MSHIYVHQDPPTLCLMCATHPRVALLPCVKYIHTLFILPRYLQRYPDLANEFGTDYPGAIAQYLELGYGQGLIGVVVGGAFGR